MVFCESEARVLPRIDQISLDDKQEIIDTEDFGVWRRCKNSMDVSIALLDFVFRRKSFEQNHQSYKNEFSLMASYSTLYILLFPGHLEQASQRRVLNSQL